MQSARLDRLRGAMHQQGFDAIFISHPKNVQYVSGLRAMMEGQVQPFGDPEYFVLVQPNRCDVLCDGRYIGEVRHREGVTAQLLEAPVTSAVFASAITVLLPAGTKAVGFEREALLYNDASALLELLPKLEWRGADDMLSNMRVRKTKEEVELLRKAQAITGKAFDHMRTTIRPGMTEKDVALEIGNFLRTHSEGNSFNPIVAFGETSCHPHYLASPTRKLKNGQIVLMDFGGIYEGYCGDLTRMLYMGKADARYREVYNLVLEAQQRCLAGIKAGMTGHQTDALCRDFFAQKGCAEAFQHGTGHGVGLAIHEEPRLKKTIMTKLEPGMVVTVEPGLYFENWGGIRIEDMIVITETGHENLTTTPKDLIELD